MEGIVARVLVVIASLAALFGVYQLYYYLTTYDNVSITQSEIAQWRTAMSAMYKFQPSKYGTSALTASYLISSGIAPNSTHASSTTLANAYGGSIAVTGAGTMFYLDYGGLTQEGCIKLATETQSTTPQDWIAIASTISGLPSSGSSMPMDPQTATTECAAGGAIRWAFP